MGKKYISYNDLDNEFCYQIEYWKKYLIENEIESIELIEMEPKYNSGFFFCKIYDTVGESRNGCGIECKEYSPRNFKNGRCRFSSYIYETTYKIRILNIKSIRII